MCDDRERLIGYVYDECDADERRRIDEHLITCVDCRQEIAGLRAVRQDLLAWDVPSHASVWRPVTPVVPFTWRDVPAWAMAAAAALILVAGAAGGVAGQALTSRPAPATQMAATVPRPGSADVSSSPAAQVADLERRLAAIRAELGADMDARVRRISAERDQVIAPRPSENVLQVITDLYNDVEGLRRRSSRIEDRVENIAMSAQMVPVSMPLGQ